MFKTTIENTLKAKFQPHVLEIVDLSEFHVNHESMKTSGGGHYQILVVSDIFEGKTLVDRHRMVYEALSADMQGRIHALSIRALTKKESQHHR